MHFLLYACFHIGEAIYATSGKSLPLSNSSLLRTQGRSGSGRLHQQRVGSGMTSSSSASSNSNNTNAEQRSREREREQQQHREREQREMDEQIVKDGMPALLLHLHSGKSRNCLCIFYFYFPLARNIFIFFEFHLRSPETISKQFIFIMIFYYLIKNIVPYLVYKFCYAYHFL